MHAFVDTLIIGIPLYRGNHLNVELGRDIIDRLRIAWHCAYLSARYDVY